MKKVVMTMLLLICTIVALAQAEADTVLISSPLKTISDRYYTALMKGKDLFGMGLAAELNHYPSPVIVFAYKKALDLSPIQVNKLIVINKELHRKLVEMGSIILKNEQTL